MLTKKRKYVFDTSGAMTVPPFELFRPPVMWI